MCSGLGWPLTRLKRETPAVLGDTSGVVVESPRTLHENNQSLPALSARIQEASSHWKILPWISRFTLVLWMPSFLLMSHCRMPDA